MTHFLNLSRFSIRNLIRYDIILNPKLNLVINQSLVVTWI